MSLTFHHLAIQCADLTASEHFYRGVLGLEVLRRWPREGGGDRSLWLRLGEGAFLALERAGEGDGSATSPLVGEGLSWLDARPGLHLIALRIAPDERATWEARLASRGVAIAHRTPFTLYVRDPEGNRVGLSHYPESHP